jgi:transposase
MITRGNSFKLLYTIYFLKIQNIYDNIKRQERERLVIDLYYNQGKTYREISKESKISPHDIGVVLNKAVEEKEESRRRNKTRR